MIVNVAKIGLITCGTFIILWIPWITSINSLLAVSLRLFPLNRGVFEDKVANVWCSLNAIYKLKQNLKNEQMALICLVATFVAIVPTNLHLFFHFKRKTFLFTLVNTSLAFFLLSFQVHEKSVLLAGVPICFIFTQMPFSVLCFLKISTLSVLPLLIRDNLQVNYFCMIISYTIIFKYLVQPVYSKDNQINKNLNFVMDLLDLIILAISLVTLFLPSPEKFPYFWSFAISFFCCIFFTIFLFEANLCQYTSLKYFKTLSMKYIY